MKCLKVRNLVLGDGIPKICVPLVARGEAQLEEALHAVLAADFDLVEFRADFYEDDDAQALERIREAVGDRPVLYTVRTSEEGGEIRIGPEAYRQRLLQAAPLADLVDVQLERLLGVEAEGEEREGLIRELHAAGTLVVGSWHCFLETPETGEMLSRLRAMQERGCDIAKLAVMPRERGDVLRLLEVSVQMLERYADRPFITMSMGDLGRISRAAGSYTGSCITFAAAGTASAPGQIPAEALRAVLKALE